jgi:hypothetical protein
VWLGAALVVSVPGKVLGAGQECNSVVALRSTPACGSKEGYLMCGVAARLKSCPSGLWLMFEWRWCEHPANPHLRIEIWGTRPTYFPGDVVVIGTSMFVVEVCGGFLCRKLNAVFAVRRIATTVTTMARVRACFKSGSDDLSLP